MNKLISPILLASICASGAAQAGIANVYSDSQTWKRAVFADGGTPSRPTTFNIPETVQLTQGVENDLGGFSVYYISRDGEDTPDTAVVNSNSNNGAAEGFQVTDFLSLNIRRGGPNRTETMEIRFDEAVSSFGADFSFIHASSSVALNADGDSLDLFAALGGSGRFDSGFIGLQFDNPISSLSFSVSTSTDVIWLDNIRTGSVSSVPVPAAAWLFGSALLGLAGIRRRS